MSKRKQQKAKRPNTPSRGDIAKTETLPALHDSTATDPKRSAGFYARRINAALVRGLEATLEVGRLLNEAAAKLALLIHPK